MPSPSEARAMAKAISQEHSARALAFFVQLDDLSTFSPDPSDVFIVSFMKSGTTLLQQLLYQLLVATHQVPSDPTGELFSDISQVVPVVESRHLTGLYQSPNPCRPRVWKSHAAASKFRPLLPPSSPPQGNTRGPRFIYCFREGRQVIRSYVDFALDWLATSPIEGDDLRKEAYRKIFLNCYLGLDDGPDGKLVPTTPLYDWFDHVRGWLQSSHTILFIHFDDLVRNLPLWVTRLARYLDIQVNSQQVDWVVAKCDRGTMAADERFKDGIVARLMGWRQDLGWRVWSEEEKGFRQVELPPECEREYQKRFEEEFGEGGWDVVVQWATRRNEEAGF